MGWIDMQKNEMLRNLEELIAGATRSRNDPLDLLAEHLDAARRYLLANSRLEYGMSLAEALKSLSCIADKTERSRIRDAVRSLIDAPASRLFAVAR
jgi:hypothetical protein